MAYATSLNGVTIQRVSMTSYTGILPAAIRTLNLVGNLLTTFNTNCFINSTYTPSRNGTCPGDADLFFLGFERENALRNFIVTYPFFA